MLVSRTSKAPTVQGQTHRAIHNLLLSCFVFHPPANSLISTFKIIKIYAENEHFAWPFLLSLWVRSLGLRGQPPYQSHFLSGPPFPSPFPLPQPLKRVVRASVVASQTLHSATGTCGWRPKWVWVKTSLPNELWDSDSISISPLPLRSSSCIVTSVYSLQTC